MIRPIQEEVRSKLRSGVAVTNLTQCIEELVLNSIDAGASNITIRLDIPNLKIQVSDNGCGITFDDLKLVGKRYSSSKCHVLKDLEHLTCYGFRGEALASLREICDVLEIVTRHRSSYRTYCKLFRNSQVLELTESRFPRTHSGTSVTIHNFFANLPVRRKSITEILDFERVRHRIASIALLHPKTAFLLINDSSGAKCLQTHICKSSVSTFSQLFGNCRSKGLQLVQFEHNNFNVSGFISTDTHHSKSLQFLFVNRRLLLKTKIHKLINTILGKSELLRKLTAPEVSSYEPGGLQTKVMSPHSAKTSDNHGIFFLNIECRGTEYDISLEPAKTLIEFQDWDSVLYCVEKCVKDFLIRHNFSLEPELSDSRGGNNSHVYETSITSLEAFEYRKEIETSNVRKSLHSSTVFRLRKATTRQDVGEEAKASLQNGISVFSVGNHQGKNLNDTVEIDSSSDASVDLSCSDSNSGSETDFLHSAKESSSSVGVATVADKWLLSNAGEFETKHSDEYQGSQVSKTACDSTVVTNCIRGTVSNSVKAAHRRPNNGDCHSNGLSSNQSVGSCCFQNSKKTCPCQSCLDTISCVQGNLLNEFPNSQIGNDAFNSGDFSDSRKAFDSYLSSDKKNNLNALNIGTDMVCSLQSSSYVKPRSSGTPNTPSTRPTTKTNPTFTSPCPITLQGVYTRKRSQGSHGASAIGLPLKNRRPITLEGSCKRRHRKNTDLEQQSTNAKTNDCNEHSFMCRGDLALQKTVDHGVNAKLSSANSDDISGTAMSQDSTIISGVNNNDSSPGIPVSLKESCDSVVSVSSDQTATGYFLSQVHLFSLDDQCKQPFEEKSDGSVTPSDFNVRNHECVTVMHEEPFCSSKEREAKTIELSLQQSSQCSNSTNAEPRLAIRDKSNNQRNKYSLTNDWFCTFDAHLGRNLFINMRTGHSSFEPPTEFNVLQDDCTERSVAEGMEVAHDYLQHVPHPVASHLSFSCTPWLPREGRGQQMPACGDKNMACPKGASQLATLYQEHQDIQLKGDKLCKWTGADALEAYEQNLFINSGSDKTVEDMLDCWYNPVFPAPAKDILKANKPGGCAKNQISVHNVVHPYRFTRDMLADMRVLRQLDDKFIVGILSQEGRDGELLVLVDQHAAHERVRLEQLQSELFEDGNNNHTLRANFCIKSSPVSPPMEVAFFAEEIRLLKTFQSEVERIGIHFAISESSQDPEETLVFVHRVPSVLVEREVSEARRGRPSVAVSKVKELIRDHLEHLSVTCGVPALIPKVISEVINSRACHGAVKFGEPLGVSECEELIERLSTCQLPFQCAHGRPSVIPLADLRFLGQKMTSQQEVSRPKLARLRSALVLED